MTRTITKHGNLKYALASGEPRVETIRPGERIAIECEINCNGGVISSIDSKITPDKVRMPFVNPATGPLFVEGAKPGKALAVSIHAMALDEIGYTALYPGAGMFPDWVRRKEFGHQTRAMRVANGFVHWSESRKLPIQPMVGVIGVAPVHGAVLTVDNGVHGGNLDVQEVGPGSTITFDIHEDGAGLYIGDCHALQGDGECVGFGATEIAATVTFSVAVIDKPARLTWPRIETATHIATVGCARPLEDAMRTAFEEMVYWLADDYGFTEAEAYLFLGQVAEARCTQMVNPKYSYICKVAKSFLV
ncbi:acetamidase/formamidase family protein [Acidiphilium sp.]|jgi:acetamidase/formamidase|uniref:acetamidase/formamidase family protein n=1 Tax=Acidiphilium sp. TaxID=527 RepID=UPI0025827FC5|nr:acetamidase/formamidase family protein [Acidiphilium sp.]